MAVANGEPAVATVLTDLPEHRSQLLVLRRIRDQDFLDQLPALNVSVRCGGIPKRPEMLPQGAAVGNDGRYHLVRDGELVCPSRAPRSKGTNHAGSQTWATDGTTYLRQQPELDRRLPKDQQRWTVHFTDVEWTASLDTDGSPVALSAIPSHQRCPLAQEHWPRPLDASPRGRVRAQLVAALGDQCTICRAQYGYAIDHDPLTHQVRGYLCRRCNDLVDFCVHISGCPYGEYVDHPPAAELNLSHPDSNWRRHDRGKAHWQAWMDYQTSENSQFAIGPGRPTPPPRPST